jgi:hypothetical protein
MKAIEAFKRAMFYISGLCSQRTLNQPGAVIERLPTNTREALQNLRSSDIDGSVERIDDLKYYVGSDQYYQNKEFQKDRLEFDKKISKEIPTPKKY